METITCWPARAVAGALITGAGGGALTVVSVVGVPPTLIASMYGMNFKYMPELAWSWGYPYGLALIAISAVAPLLWFKWRGWF